MALDQALRSAANMGARAGHRFRATATATRNPFRAVPGAGRNLADAWTLAYVEAAYRRGGDAPWPADPTGQGHGATSWGALTAAGPDTRGQTAPVTSTTDDEWATGLHAVADAGQRGGDALAVLRAAAAGDPLAGVAIMAYLTGDDAQHLAVPDGDPAEELHVTLGYLSEPATAYTPEQRQALQDALTAVWVGPVVASPFGVAHLNRNDPEREPCVVILVQSADLASAHDAVSGAIGQADLQASDTFPTWVPHITLGYNLDPATVPEDATGPDVTFDRLVVAWGTDKAEITSGTALTAATEDDMTAPAAPTTTDTAAPVTEPVDDAAATEEQTEPGWSGPLALLNAPSSDHRILTANGRFRVLPLPLNWQHKSSYGHDGSSVVGAIHQVEIRDGQIWGRGNYLGGYNEDVERAKQQVADGLGLVSVDLSPGEVWFVDAAGNPIDPATFTGDFDDVFMVNDDWEFAGVTIVNFPAFDGVRITNDPMPAGDVGHPVPMQDPSAYAAQNPAPAQTSTDGDSVLLPDGSTVRVGDPVLVPNAEGDGDGDAGTVTAIDTEAQTVTVTLTPDAEDDSAELVTVTVPVADIRPAGDPADPALPTATDGGRMAINTRTPLEGGAAVDTLLASSYAEPYTAAFFQQRTLTGPTPLTVNRDTGEVFGHLAQWGECHVGRLADGVCTTPPVPKDPTFPYFHLGEVQTDDGPIPIGKITVGGGHASTRVGLMAAAEHYDNSCAQVAVVRAYPDDYGIQFTGQIIPGTPPERVDEMMRAGQLSGDWRKPRGDWELMAALAVNVPGFPVKRPTPRYGLIGDRQVSLVAAGMVEPPPEPADESVQLPSGAQVSRPDWDAMVAAAAEAIGRNPAKGTAQVIADIATDAGLTSPADKVALQRAQARLRLRTRKG